MTLCYSFLCNFDLTYIFYSPTCLPFSSNAQLKDVLLAHFLSYVLLHLHQFVCNISSYSSCFFWAWKLWGMLLWHFVYLSVFLLSIYYLSSIYQSICIHVRIHMSQYNISIIKWWSWNQGLTEPTLSVNLECWCSNR